MDQLITAAGKFLQNLQIRFAVCGGYALDLFLDKALRVHGDIDVCVFEEDRNRILQYMLQENWRVYEFRGQGKVRPLNSASVSDIGRNLMCLKGECELVKFFPSEDKELLYHQFFHTGIKQFNYLEFLFNQREENSFIFDRNKNIRRELSKAVLFREEIPYLAPEIILLYKSFQTENAEYQYDFEQVYPHMSCEQRKWFLQSLSNLFPDGHPWSV